MSGSVLPCDVKSAHSSRLTTPSRFESRMPSSPRRISSRRSQDTCLLDSSMRPYDSDTRRRPLGMDVRGARDLPAMCFVIQLAFPSTIGFWEWAPWAMARPATAEQRRNVLMLSAQRGEERRGD
ncbi:hypothetical protein Trco_004382 [Trichoderma cornu-damae]|uniref:Uncharacterized protein n=1 Tax=Trichoderma cornu-damae TaxID=654480 RepID=A0A9P8QMX1_9HYPO|nr:hypothetical protein Trco_004382 [Trichoderma cornu-damae]